MTGRRSLTVLAASGLAALSTIVVTVVAARSLSVAPYAQFLVYWSLLFGVFQVLSGLQNEASRAVSASDLGATPVPGGGTPGRMLLTAATLAGGATALVAGAAAWWAPHVGASAPVVAVATVAVLGYGCHLTVVGSLAGRREWDAMAGVNAFEASARLVAVLAVGAIAPSLNSLQISAAVPALVWLLLVVVARPVRSAARARGDVRLAQLLANGGWALVAAAAGAVLINGFPAITRLVVGGDPPVLAGLLLGIQLTRAPLMMPLMAFQGVAIATFVRISGRRLSALVKPLVAVGAVGVALAALAAVLGPWAMGLLYGTQYVLSPLVLAGLTFAAVSVAALTLTGTATIALGAHRAYLAGWIVGAGVTVGLLAVLPLPAAGRVIAALLVGPLFGVVVHLLAIRARDVGAV